MNSPWREYDEIAGTPADPKNNDVLITKLPKDTYGCFSRPIRLSVVFPRGKNTQLFSIVHVEIFRARCLTCRFFVIELLNIYLIDSNVAIFENR